MDFRCVHCGHRIKTLFVQYSPGNIRLMRCENCRAVADEYIECEITILLIDLILHKPKAYRHLLFNERNLATDSKGLLWRLTFSYLFLDAYRILVLKKTEKEWRLFMSFSSLVWRCQKVLVNVFFGNFLFFCILLHGTRIVQNTSDMGSRYKGLLLAILISSYLKIFLIAIMVWEFPSSVIFIVDIFVLSSNMVALKVGRCKLWLLSPMHIDSLSFFLCTSYLRVGHE
ncbi:protein ARV 2-like isoform X2 [Malania oleifera]|uniref:protein ARV 2-like isoform X2 n=1 Tax=Malania oleifera TaxID=397392 RepID=UPI0025AEB8C5|nr:protein ARV 2-like isoform X2 [Malania oleifera]